MEKRDRSTNFMGFLFLHNCCGPLNFSLSERLSKCKEKNKHLWTDSAKLSAWYSSSTQNALDRAVLVINYGLWLYPFWDG
jgi:hypothetical protein